MRPPSAVFEFTAVGGTARGRRAAGVRIPPTLDASALPARCLAIRPGIRRVVRAVWLFAALSEVGSLASRVSVSYCLYTTRHLLSLLERL